MIVEVLWRVCRIRVNQGKLVGWSASGEGAPPGIAELNTQDHTVWRGDAPPDQRGVKILGAPIGCDSFARACGAEGAAKEQSPLDGILQLESLQIAWLL
eukprot:12396277-Karenia_brevis.AAC.1